MAFSVEDQIIARPLSRKQRQAAVGVRKARKKRKKVILCSRDMRIMRSLFEGKVMSREQINKQFFPDVSKYTVNIRLNKIMSLGLIKRKPIAIERGVFYGYSLTQKGLAEIKPTLPRYLLEAQKNLRRCSERESERYKKPYERSEYTLHDIALNDIRKAFERRSTVQRYYTENVMQSCNEYHDDSKFQPFIELNSDAMAKVDTRIGILNLAIEFDATHKSKHRYRQKVNDYYIEQGVDGVLYICAHNYILQALFKVDREVSERHQCDHKLYFALLADVTGVEGKMTFTNASKDIFCVR